MLTILLALGIPLLALAPYVKRGVSMHVAAAVCAGVVLVLVLIGRGGL